jgi:hypothetical protein
VGIYRSITGGSSQIFILTVWNMVTSTRVTKLLGQTVVDQVQLQRCFKNYYLKITSQQASGDIRASQKGLDKTALRQKALVTKGRIDWNKNTQRVSGLHVKSRQSYFCYWPLTHMILYTFHFFFFHKKSSNFSGRLDFYSTAKKIYLPISDTDLNLWLVVNANNYRL